MLSEKQERFCKEYVIDLNGTQAAIRSGYSENTANEQASRLLANVKVKARIQELQSGISDRLQITADMVVKELAALGFYNIQDLLTDSNSVEDVKSLDRDKAKPIVGIKVTERRLGSGENVERIVSTELKLADKISALEKVGKHLGIFEKDNGQKKPDVATFIQFSGNLSDLKTDESIGDH